MELPPLLILESEEEYREHYIRTLANGPAVITPDGIQVDFYEDKFDYVFWGRSSSWQKKKDRFAPERAQRMDWIRPLLVDPNADIRRESGSDYRNYRLILYYPDPYMVVTKAVRRGRETFMNAYPCSRERLNEKSKFPKW